MANISQNCLVTAASLKVRPQVVLLTSGVFVLRPYGNRPFSAGSRLRNWAAETTKIKTTIPNMRKENRQLKIVISQFDTGEAMRVPMDMPQRTMPAMVLRFFRNQRGIVVRIGTKVLPAPMPRMA